MFCVTVQTIVLNCLKSISKTMKEREIKKLEAEIKRLKKLVYYDELTGLLNRRGFKEEVEEIFLATSLRRNGEEKRTAAQLPFSIVFVDLDDFKKINDTYGHEEGDKVLKHAAKILKRLLRKNDIYARWGGEEFVVALPNATKRIAKEIAEKLRSGIEKSKISLGGKKVTVTMSVGIVMHNHENHLLELIEKADKAMYKAKKSGKNRTVVFVHD